MYYELYIDVLFLVNFLMDYILLLIARRILKCPATHGNICLGAFIGALFTCVVVSLQIPYTFVKLFLFHGFINIVMIIIGLKIRGIRKCIKAFLTIYISGFLMGGVLGFIYQYMGGYIEVGSLFLVIAIACYYIAIGLLSFLMKILRFGNYYCQVILILGEKQCKTQAIVDTGNHLTDHLTGKAVSIIGKETAEKLLENNYPDKIRFIPYRTIGKKNGVIPVITLDKICIEGEEDEWIDHPLIGISDTKISENEEYDMILNPEV